jgi:anti-sigma B factor antagonist
LNTHSEILVSQIDEIVWIRVEGKGSCDNSRGLKRFSKEMLQRGARQFIIDLGHCHAIDSTFIGTLAAIALWLRERGEGSVSLVNLNERNSAAVRSLGLDQLIHIGVSSPVRPAGEAPSTPLEEDAGPRAETLLEAHEALIRAAPENLPRFKDVIRYLKEDLNLDIEG